MQMMLPVLVGVILLVGLFKTFVSDALISSVFTGEPLSDSFFGAALGSVLAAYFGWVFTITVSLVMILGSLSTGAVVQLFDRSTAASE